MTLGRTTWSATAGSITSRRPLHGPLRSGAVTVTATSGTVSGTAAGDGDRCGPTVATAAAATPATVTGTTTALSVLGADDAGESNLTYTWATTRHAAGGGELLGQRQQCGQEHHGHLHARPGSYTFQVTITDAGGLSTTSSVDVTVNQTLDEHHGHAGPPTLGQPRHAAVHGHRHRPVRRCDDAWQHDLVGHGSARSSRRAVHGPLRFQRP